MKVFVTGASGFIGSAVVSELLRAGHQVVGLARSEKSAGAIRAVGAEVIMGALEDLAVLQEAASGADGVVHTGFSHDFMASGDFSQYPKAAELDRAAIFAMGEALAGTQKALVVTSGMLGLPLVGGVVTEESTTRESSRMSEITALQLAGTGVRASVVRLPPSVHDQGDAGFVPSFIGLAKKHGVSAYPSGGNRWCAVHRQDAASLFRLAVEGGRTGALYNAVGDGSVALKEIATLIGQKLQLPVQAVEGAELARHFEWMQYFITMDCPATALATREGLGWQPAHPGLLEDMQAHYF